ncbi:MAG: YIP1 family protein [Chthoniobacterales bacterium]|nr:YIP1 family protein [Chthoniobacterales bacterium]
MEKLLVHIARQGQSLGSFSEEEVREGVASKRFSKEDDLAWTSGMTKWRPLREVMDAWSSDSLAGTVITPAALPEPAWERRSELGFFKALFQTIFEVLFSPSKTFSKMKTTGGLGGPLLFYVITLSVVVPINCLYQAQVIKDIAAFMPQLAAQPGFQKVSAGPSISLQQMTIMSLKMILSLFLMVALLHLSLKIVKSAQERFEATFRMLCYLSGAYALIGTLFCLINLAPGRLGLIPINIRISIYIIEALVGVSIFGALSFIGLKQVHHLSSWRTTFVLLFAMLLPFLIALAVILLVAILITIVLVAKHFMH